MSATFAFVKWQYDTFAPIIQNVTRTLDRMEDSGEPLDPVRPAFFSSSACRLHNPGAFPFFRRRTAFATSCSEGGEQSMDESGTISAAARESSVDGGAGGQLSKSE